MRASASEPLLKARQRILPVFTIQRSEPAAHAQFSAAIADQHHILHYDRRHGSRLAELDVAHLRFPYLLAGVRIYRDRMVVQRVVNDLAIGVTGAAIDDIAAGDTNGAARSGFGSKIHF